MICCFIYFVRRIIRFGHLFCFAGTLLLYCYRMLQHWCCYSSFQPCLLLIVFPHPCGISIHNTARIPRFGDINERIQILGQYAAKKTIMTSIVDSSLITKLSASGMGKDKSNIVKYHPSMPFICEEYRVLMNIIYRELCVCTPSFRNESTLYQELHLSMSGDDPLVDKMPQFKSLILTCPDCVTAFIIAGERPGDQLISEAPDNPKSPLNVHATLSGHSSNYRILRLDKHFKRLHDFPPDLLVPLMNLTLSNLGWECTSSGTLLQLPKLIRDGVNYLLSNFHLPLSSTVSKYV